MRPVSDQDRARSRLSSRKKPTFGFSLVEFFVVLSFCVVLWFAFFKTRDVEIVEKLENGLVSLDHSEISEVSTVLGPDIIIPLYESAALRRISVDLSQYSESDREVWEYVIHNSSSPDSLRSNIDAAIIAEQIFSEPNFATVDYARDLELRLDELVREIGGDIDKDSGLVTLPADAVFVADSFEVAPQHTSTLRSVCLSWLELSSRLPEVFRLVVEVEMPEQMTSHTSAQSTAYFHGLVFAQTRALNVLSFCMGQVENTRLYNWALSKTVANGRSSEATAFVPHNDKVVQFPHRIIFRTIVDRYEIGRRRWN